MEDLNWNERLKKSSEALEKFMNGPDGAKYIADMRRKERIAQGRIRKMHVFLSTARTKKLTELESRFIEKEKKYQARMLTNRHVETQSEIFSTLVGVFKKYGKTVDNDVVSPAFIKKIGEIDRSNMTSEEKVSATITLMKRISSARGRADMFLGSVIRYGKYTLKTYSGQGVFYRIYKGRKQIW